MNLGDVTRQSVPKMMLVASPRHGGAITARSFIPIRAHASIGVLGAVNMATACLLPDTPAGRIAVIPSGTSKTLPVEYPSGETSCIVDVDAAGAVVAAGVLRTARKVIDGVVFA